MKKTGLGKGLGALIPPEVSNSQNDTKLREILTSDVVPNPRQPRKYFDEESIASLAASINELGLLQPILVREIAGKFELIAGERRWKAARRVGLQTIPALVNESDDISSLEQALVENLHRQDLDPLEEASAYLQLIEEFSMTHEKVAQRVGKSRATVSNTLRLLQLPPGVQKAVQLKTLSVGHARALLGTPDRSFQEQLALRTVAEGLTVRDVEELIRLHVGGEDAEQLIQKVPESKNAGSQQERDIQPARHHLRPPGFFELEELLAEKLNTRVKVEMSNKKGKLIIEFATLEDLERIYKEMFAE